MTAWCCCAGTSLVDRDDGRRRSRALVGHALADAGSPYGAAFREHATAAGPDSPGRRRAAARLCVVGHAARSRSAGQACASWPMCSSSSSSSPFLLLFAHAWGATGAAVAMLISTAAFCARLGGADRPAATRSGRSRGRMRSPQREGPGRVRNLATGRRRPGEPRARGGRVPPRSTVTGRACW